MAIEISSSALMIVEGNEEKMFFEALINYMGLKNIQIMPIGGKEKLRANLKALVSSPRFSTIDSLNIVRDANKNPKGAFQSVCDALKASKLPVPDRPLISEGTKPKVTIMILPKEDLAGMLEDVCLKSVQNDPALFCIEQYFKCLRERGLSPPQNESKAKVQAFLASRKEPGKRLGEAAQAGYWPWDSDAFKEIKDFLKMIS